MSDVIAIDFSKPVPVFPLQACALLPHATIPLHIFEPRYRAMVNDALESHGLIAMATFEGDRWQSEYQGSPPIRPILCVGYIVQHRRLADGRYYLLLQGVCRARLIEELPSEPYRLAMLEPAEQPDVTEEGFAEIRRRLDELLNDPELGELAAISAIHNWLTPEVPTLALIDLALMHLFDQPEQRYAMLAETDAFERARRLEAHLARTRSVVRRAAMVRPSRTDDEAFIHLN